MRHGPTRVYRYDDLLNVLEIKPLHKRLQKAQKGEAWPVESCETGRARCFLALQVRLDRPEQHGRAYRLACHGACGAYKPITTLLQVKSPVKVVVLHCLQPFICGLEMFRHLPETESPGGGWATSQELSAMGFSA